MAMKQAPWSYPVWHVFCICGLLTLVGCGGGRPRLFPVSGTVTLDGEPLINKTTRDGIPLLLDNNTGRMDYAVIFHPETDKGNKNPWTCEGWLSCQPRTAGKYEMWTVAFMAKAHRGVDWALLARNTAVSLDGLMWEGHDSGTRKGVPLGWYKVTIRAEWDVAEVEIEKIRKYLKTDTTPLSIEVVADPKPGQYDIKLEK